MAFAVRFARQVVNAFALLLAVLVLNFFLIHLTPGDPVQVIAGEMGGASPEVVAALRMKYGLDHSLLEQLFTYLGIAHEQFANFLTRHLYQVRFAARYCGNYGRPSGKQVDITRELTLCVELDTPIVMWIHDLERAALNYV